MKTIFKYLIIVGISIFYITGCSSTDTLIVLDADAKFAHAMKLYEEEDYLEALTEFEAIILQYPGSDVADDSQFYLAMTRYQREEYLIAAYEFSKLIRNLKVSDFVAEAQFMLAECYYELSPHYSLDQRFTKKAIEEYQAFIDFFPLDERVPDAEGKINEMNDKLAEKEFHSAEIYESLEYTKAAKYYYQSIIDKYHDTEYAPKASYNLIQLLIEREELEEAKEEISMFLTRYTGDDHYDEVQQLKVQLQ